MNVERFIVGPLQTNCYIVQCEKTHESILIDPGDVSQELLGKIDETSIKAIVLTHGHFDHIGGVNTVVDETGAPVLISSVDAPMLSDPDLNGSFMIGAEIQAAKPDRLLSGGDTISFGESSLNVIHTPGHTEGGLSFADEGEFIISGDTLFKLSVGRWDLPGGDFSKLESTLKNVFSVLDDSTIVYPGHGDTTGIGFEKEHNQFMRNY